jgi:hypothetical protein
VKAKAVNYTNIWDYIDPDRKGIVIILSPEAGKGRIFKIYHYPRW